MTVKFLLLISIVFVVGLLGIAYGHTIDSVGDYRLEIGWMNEPVVSGETNGIELFVSLMEPGIPVEEQKFKNGVTGLEETLEMQLVYKDQKIMLPFVADHNIPGKYYAFVDPITPGHYQANILGKIGDTNVSLSMHPPKVDDRSYMEFPPRNNTQEQILEEHSTIQEGHSSLQEQINQIQDSLNRLESSAQVNNLGFVGVGLGIAGIVIALIAISRSKK